MGLEEGHPTGRVVDRNAAFTVLLPYVFYEAGTLRQGSKTHFSSPPRLSPALVLN
ncbi:hypothetical protein PM082_002344 [Marasmius tenuissimus]|nr:hypothetical protein PM082_002344 [Marasmius tenuissimus]